VENSSTTEQGSYTLNGDVDSGDNTGLELANPNAVWRLPTLNEWYKAAYYDPNYGGPGVAGYWTYATRSNNAPGNVIGSGTDEANYDVNGLSESNTPYVSPVGSFTNSASYYGTYDQNGDVFQWDTDIYGGDARGIRGGSWVDSNPYYLASTTNLGSDPSQEAGDLGFRIEEADIPEPGSTSLALTGAIALGLLLRRRIQRRAAEFLK
jgi:formylglycine-generating enzyme required for sulfatase activity